MTPTRDALPPGLSDALAKAGFRGEVDQDTALLAAMSTDNSVYQIHPDMVVAPRDAADVVTLLSVLEEPRFSHIPLTARGGGTGTNGQALNQGIILDFRRHMHRLLEVNASGMWADVEPGIVLDDLNSRLKPHGLFFAPETSTSTRCTVGGMVSTDASGKGSRIYGKTSDNLLGIETARCDGLLSSLSPTPEWAKPVLENAELAARTGRAGFIANTPKLNRRFTGYDLERACAADEKFDWWRLFPGSEGTLGPITRIRLRLRRIEPHKRLVVAAFGSFRDALSAAVPLLQDEPTAIEVMDERVQSLAFEAGLLSRLPASLRADGKSALAYVFIEFNGSGANEIDRRVASCHQRLSQLAGIRATHIAEGLDEIRDLWSVRSAAVGLLGKVAGRARPVAFVEDCVVPPENLPAFLDGFLDILKRRNLDFGIYGHVDVGCLHIRPALDMDSVEGRTQLAAISDEVFGLVQTHGGIFWGEHGKGIRGAYLAEWLGSDAYQAMQGVKRAFDPAGRYNPGKLVALEKPVLGIATTPFRSFNSPENDPLEKAFRCNGNAQCLSYAASVPMCPSFKASGDLRHSPKGRADALRAWHDDKRKGKSAHVSEQDLMGVLDTCLGCSACASSCPVQVDIPTMRAAFYSDYYSRNPRSLEERALLLSERLSPWLKRFSPVLRPFWPLVTRLVERMFAFEDLPDRLARGIPARYRLSPNCPDKDSLQENAVLVWQDWFTCLFDEAVQTDVIHGLQALGYAPFLVEMLPAGKVAKDLGDKKAHHQMEGRLLRRINELSALQKPMIGLDPAFVMDLRKSGLPANRLMLPQEFLSGEVTAGRAFPLQLNETVSLSVFSHCTETSAGPNVQQDWQTVFEAIGARVETPSTGCCGMAGMFGHKSRHRQVTRKLFYMSWADPLSKAGGRAAATGFSCRCQGRRFGGQSMRHPLGLIAELAGR